MTVTAAASTSQGTYTLTVTAAGGGLSHTASVSLIIIPGLPLTFPARVNAGGGAYSGSGGRTWLADEGSLQGGNFSTTAPISGTSDPALYQTARYSTTGTLTYAFGAPDGAYQVRLSFAELWYTSAGQRVFDVVINGVTVTSHLDVFAEAGGANKAYDRMYDVTVNGGLLAITLTSVTGNPNVNAIEITRNSPDF
jgi:hypothetical protein